jgi:hypothetical protein
LPGLFRSVVSGQGFIASEVVQRKKMMEKKQQKRRRRQKTKNKKKGYIATGLGSSHEVYVSVDVDAVTMSMTTCHLQR